MSSSRPRGRTNACKFAWWKSSIANSGQRDTDIRDRRLSLAGASPRLFSKAKQGRLVIADDGGTQPKVSYRVLDLESSEPNIDTYYCKGRMPALARAGKKKGNPLSPIVLTTYS